MHHLNCNCIGRTRTPSNDMLIVVLSLTVSGVSKVMDSNLYCTGQCGNVELKVRVLGTPVPWTTVLFARLFAGGVYKG